MVYLLVFNKIKKEFRNEILLIYFILNNIYFRLDECLENILIMYGRLFVS